jgi:hypothetical protein
MSKYYIIWEAEAIFQKIVYFAKNFTVFKHNLRVLIYNI